MIKVSLMCVLVVVALLSAETCAVAPGDGCVTQISTIPLSRVRAWDMPGTSDIRALEPQSFGEAVRHLPSSEQLRRHEQSVISQVLRPLAARSNDDHAGPGFAVNGVGIAALENVRAVLVNKQLPRSSFGPSEKVSIVFFSRVFGSWVHVREVRRQGNRVEVRYCFSPHMEAQQTVNFALIPIGRLAPGEIKVDIVRLPMEKKFSDMGIEPTSSEWESRIVCKSFRFVVE